MPIVRRKAPVQKSLVFTQTAPPRRKSAESISVDELRARLHKAVPSSGGVEGAEVNPDGSSYQTTIERYAKRVRNPMTAIRAKCVECCGGSTKEVAECTVTGCALHLFRAGKNPFHSRSKIHQEAMAEATHEEGEDDGDE